MLTQFLGLVLPFLTRVLKCSTNIQEFIECLIYHPLMISYNIILYTQGKKKKEKEPPLTGRWTVGKLTWSYSSSSQHHRMCQLREDTLKFMAFQVAQWYRFCLPMQASQEMELQSVNWEDPLE